MSAVAARRRILLASKTYSSRPFTRGTASWLFFVRGFAATCGFGPSSELMAVSAMA